MGLICTLLMKCTDWYYRRREREISPLYFWTWSSWVKTWSKLTYEWIKKLSVESPLPPPFFSWPTFNYLLLQVSMKSDSFMNTTARMVVEDLIISYKTITVCSFLTKCSSTNAYKTLSIFNKNLFSVPHHLQDENPFLSTPCTCCHDLDYVNPSCLCLTTLLPEFYVPFLQKHKFSMAHTFTQTSDVFAHTIFTTCNVFVQFLPVILYGSVHVISPKTFLGELFTPTLYRYGSVNFTSSL